MKYTEVEKDSFIGIHPPKSPNKYAVIFNDGEYQWTNNISLRPDCYSVHANTLHELLERVLTAKYEVYKFHTEEQLIEWMKKSG